MILIINKYFYFNTINFHNNEIGKNGQISTIFNQIFSKK